MFGILIKPSSERAPSEPEGERVREAGGAVLENDIEKNEERTVRF